MACAARRSLEDGRAPQRRAEVRQRRHERVDHGLDQLEERVKAPKPTREALTPAVLALRQAWPEAVTAGLGEPVQRAVGEQRPARCSPGGPVWSARGPQARPVGDGAGPSVDRRVR
jgi:hypothetical protein